MSSDILLEKGNDDRVMVKEKLVIYSSLIRIL